MSYRGLEGASELLMLAECEKKERWLRPNGNDQLILKMQVTMMDWFNDLVDGSALLEDKPINYCM